MSATEAAVHTELRREAALTGPQSANVTELQHVCPLPPAPGLTVLTLRRGKSCVCQGEKAHTDNTFPQGRGHFHSSTTDRATAEAREALFNERCVTTASLIALPVAHCHFKHAFKRQRGLENIVVPFLRFPFKIITLNLFIYVLISLLDFLLSLLLLLCLLFFLLHFYFRVLYLFLCNALNNNTARHS